MEEESTLQGLWRTVRWVLIACLVVCVGAAASFLVAGPFTLRTFSTRLFWGGIGAVVLGGLTVWSALGSYNTLGTPSVFTAGSDSRIATERIKDHLSANAKRYGFIIRMLATGLVCLCLSALLEILTR